MWRAADRCLGIGAMGNASRDLRRGGEASRSRSTTGRRISCKLIASWVANTRAKRCHRMPVLSDTSHKILGWASAEQCQCLKITFFWIGACRPSTCLGRLHTSSSARAPGSKSTPRVSRRARLRVDYRKATLGIDAGRTRPRDGVARSGIGGRGGDTCRAPRLHAGNEDEAGRCGRRSRCARRRVAFTPSRGPRRRRGFPRRVLETCFTPSRRPAAPSRRPRRRRRRPGGPGS